MLKTFPLASISMQEAIALQFKVVDSITRNFDGYQVLTRGDLGLDKSYSMPCSTRKAEKVFAQVFDAPDAAFVRGAGTGAIRFALLSFLKAGEKLLIHKAPIYPTTKVTLESMGTICVEADYNKPSEIKEAIAANPDLRGALLQLTRQKIDDSYDCGEVIKTIKTANPALVVLTDDNYAAMKVKSIGVQCGADLSSFSCFKLQGPEGVGVVLGEKPLVEAIHRLNYSGGSQVQGHEALDALRGIVYAPVMLAVQAQVNDELVRRLCAGELPQVKNAFLANAQSKVLLLEFKEEIAERLLEITPRYGAAAHPVGAESKYELVPMIYRVSGTFRTQDPTLEKRMIRINPMRGGADTVIRILKEALAELEREGKRTEHITKPQ